MKYRFVCRRLIEGKRDGAEVRGGLSHGDCFARADPRRGDDREQVELIPVFADQHGATSPGINLVLESSVGGAGVKQKRVRLMKGLFLIAADGLRHGVLDR